MKEHSNFYRFWKGSSIGRWLFLAGVVMLIAGAVVFALSPKNAVKTTGTITDIQTESFGEGDETHRVFVDYDVDGTHYHEELSNFSPDYAVGKTIDVYYDPADPAKISGDNTGIYLYLFIGGGVLLAAGIAGFIMSYLKLKKINAATEDGRAGFEKFAVSKGREVADTEATYYFVYDKKPVHQGYYLEDKNRKKLFEAVMTKNSLISEYEYDFTDCSTGKTTKHLVGHMQNWSLDISGFNFDVSSSISFDGINAWKYLSEMGVGVHLNGLSLTDVGYDVTFEGETIATLKQTSMYVHEEDEAAHPAASKVLNPMFFRLYTKEKDLSALFLVTFVLARTDFSLQRL